MSFTWATNCRPSICLVSLEGPTRILRDGTGVLEDTYSCTTNLCCTQALVIPFGDGSPRTGCFLGEHTSSTLHTSLNTSSGTQLACMKIKSGILSGKPSLWCACPGLVACQAPKAGQAGFCFPVRDIGVLWRTKFLHLDPKTNSGRSEALLKISGKKLLHL